ncbi:MAG TPA: hypothetical protein VKX49_12750 [Bryobacteraceae bacterium]|nr:hypothetical protein [Bryobacteraceae bacterium]
MKIPGLPEGVDVVRFGVCGPEEFELVGEEIYRGGRHHPVHHMIVQPEKGWEFVEVSAFNRMYKAVRMYDPPKKLTVVFTCSHSGEMRAVEAAIKSVSDTITTHATDWE